MSAANSQRTKFNDDDIYDLQTQFTFYAMDFPSIFYFCENFSFFLDKLFKILNPLKDIKINFRKAQRQCGSEINLS
jgi:hypothetical protein